MRIRFLRDFRGRATGEQFYPKGAEADLEDGGAVIAEGAAEAVVDEPPAEEEEAPPEPETPTVPRRGRKVEG